MSDTKPNQPHESPWMSRGRAAKYLDVGLRKMDHLIASGQVQGYKLGGRWKFHRDELDRAIRRNPV